MIRTCLTAVLPLLLAASPAAAASIEAGVAAYQQKKYDLAMKEWAPLADAGDPEGMYHLGVLYDKGRGVKTDRKKAAELIRGAATKGYAPALTYAGMMFEKGRGFRQDYETARTMYGFAVERKHPYAFYRMGLLYEKGRGVSVNPKKAAEWYLQGAALDDSWSQAKLCAIYQEGGVVRRNLLTAREYGEKSARADNYRGQELYATMYATGVGALRNLTKAYYWFALAAENGSWTATAKRKGVEKGMSKTQLRSARRSVQEYRNKKRASLAPRDETPEEGKEAATSW
jgi:TPR repeat protein